MQKKINVTGAKTQAVWNLKRTYERNDFLNHEPFSVPHYSSSVN